MSEETKINCPIFQQQEPIIKEFTNKINKTKDPKKKIEYASELLREVGALLTCSQYDGDSLNCQSCHFIANLRKRTAGLIMRAKKLA